MLLWDLSLDPATAIVGIFGFGCNCNLAADLLCGLHTLNRVNDLYLIESGFRSGELSPELLYCTNNRGSVIYPLSFGLAFAIRGLSGSPCRYTRFFEK